MMQIRIGKTEKYIYEKLEEKGALLFSVIDPVDYDTPEHGIKTAIGAAEGGADAILIGGSTGAQGELLEIVSKGIKDKVNVPVILFPGNIATVTRNADAFYFLSMLNARNPYWITQVQTVGAPLIKQLGIEPLPVGYIVVAPGGTVGWIGDANLVPREKPKIASALALAGQYLGNRFIITDVGSNPQSFGKGPVPLEMIREVKKTIDATYIVAGGIQNGDDLRNTIKAGADIVQIGTAIERSDQAMSKTEFFAKTIREEARKRKKA